MAIAFVIGHPAITAAIIGPRTLEHLESQLTAADVTLSDDVLDRIDEINPPGVDSHQPRRQRLDPTCPAARPPTPLAALRDIAPSRMRTMQTLTLSNGVEMPALGLGVFQTPPDETRDAVQAALGCGYRHIDTAAAYGNERQVGEAVHASDFARSEIFLETKIWISDYGYDETLHAFDKSADKLGVDQVDLLILHQALPSAFDRTLEAYRALEALLADGKVRAIGVSNFLVQHPHCQLPRARHRRAGRQPDRGFTPTSTQREVQSFGAEHGILTQAWSPIGGITHYRDSGHRSAPFRGPVITGVADAHDKSPAQVMLLAGVWQQGRSVIPASSRWQVLSGRCAVGTRSGLSLTASGQAFPQLS